MFRHLGNFVTRYWALLLVGWCAVFLVVSDPVAKFWGAPTWDEVVRDGEFRYLPDDMASRKGEDLYHRAFSKDLNSSTVVIVARRENGPEGLNEEDKTFVRDVLKPRLEQIAEETGGLLDPDSGETTDKNREAETDASESSTASPGNADEQLTPIIANIRTFDDQGYGELLISEDKKAMLIVLELTTEFQEERNKGLISKIETLIGRDGAQKDASRAKERIPLGLDLTLSGSATFGRDTKVAAQVSADSIDYWTIILVAVLLMMIYRSPVLMFVPLLSVIVSVYIAIHVLVYLANAELIQLFESAGVYVRVVMMGAGIDYCMFLMARYKEELDAGATIDEAIAASIEKVGAALTASAATVMCGIGMMVFAEFGKFQQAGVSMSLSLIFVLLASLTFTPAILCLLGRWAFWPQMRTERISASSGWLSPTSLVSRLWEKQYFSGAWKKVAAALLARPGTIWLASMLVMLPFAVIGVVFYNNLSYGLISELPDDKPSVIGTAAVQAHFPAGTSGPVMILIENPNVDFSQIPDDAQTQMTRKGSVPRFVAFQDETQPTAESTGQTTRGYEGIRKLTQWLEEHREELRIADIRSVVKPLGISPAAERAHARIEQKIEDLDKKIAAEKSFLKKSPLMAERIATLKTKDQKRNETYISDKGEMTGHVTRIDVVFQDDPFSKDSLDRLDELERTIQNVIQNNIFEELGPALDPDSEQTNGSKVYFVGTTPSIRDLKIITGSDQVRIDILVIAGVFLILVILLRRPAVSAYLIVSVFFSYLVTLGVTTVAFYLMDPAGFTGLDWKVPMFLFTILIAVGEDYNIFLMTRIEEEQEKHGPIDGITIALLKTGSIISSCGLIMAGTFASLLFGSLDGMIQLGFALSFGVLLDTFVVRPILVPAYLIMLYQGRFGVLGKFLGAEDKTGRSLIKH